MEPEIVRVFRFAQMHHLGRDQDGVVDVEAEPQVFADDPAGTLFNKSHGQLSVGMGPYGIALLSPGFQFQEGQGGVSVYPGGIDVNPPVGCNVSSLFSYKNLPFQAMNFVDEGAAYA